MLTLTALIVLGTGPVEPAAPKTPAPPEAKAPVAPSVESPGAKEPSAPRAHKAKKGTLDSGTSERSADIAQASGTPAEPSDATDTKKGTEEQAKGADASPAVPPSLSKKGLCGELLKVGKELSVARKKIDEDRRALELERLSLEKLKAEIADARIQLRAETERLEGLLEKRGAAADDEKPALVEKTKPQTASAPKPQDLDGLAKTMRSMRPETAAALVMKSDPTLGAGVLRRMKPADAGAILDRLKPDFAAELLALMATIPAAPANKGIRP